MVLRYPTGRRASGTALTCGRRWMRKDIVCSQASLASRSYRIWCVCLDSRAVSTQILQWPPLSLCMFVFFCFYASLLLFWLFFRYVLLLFTLFFIPGVMMIVAYGLISRELYRGMQFELSQSTETTGEIHHKFNPNRKKVFCSQWFSYWGWKCPNPIFGQHRQTNNTAEGRFVCFASSGVWHILLLPMGFCTRYIQKYTSSQFSCYRFYLFSCLCEVSPCPYTWHFSQTRKDRSGIARNMILSAESCVHQEHRFPWSPVLCVVHQGWDDLK